jgi:hypothetical protein
MMEQLQESYVSCVAATAGCLFSKVERDIIGFDVMLIRPSMDPKEQEVSVYVQLKSSTIIRPDLSKDYFSYQLKKRDYFDRLSTKRKDPKALLIVMTCPPRQAEWTKATHDRLELSHCCYWVCLEGQESDAEYPSIRIPTANMFDAVSLTDILNRLDRGDSLDASR